MTATMDVEIRRISSQFDPLSDDYLADPYPFISEARQAAPVFYSEKLDHWVVTRYQLIRHIFLNPQIFSAANAPVLPPCPQAQRALEDGGFRAVPTLANVDPPAHTRVRRAGARTSRFPGTAPDGREGADHRAGGPTCGASRFARSTTWCRRRG